MTSVFLRLGTWKYVRTARAIFPRTNRKVSIDWRLKGNPQRRLSCNLKYLSKKCRFRDTKFKIFPGGGDTPELG